MSAEEHDPEKRTILLVDDEPDNLIPMQYLLEEDYRVLTAESGERALSLLEQQEVAIVIADQRMPGMTGVELLNVIRSRFPKTVRVILTAYSDFDAMLTAINEGRVYRYIIKPWDDQDMRVTIRQAVEWRDLQLLHGQLAAEIAEINEVLSARNRELEQAHDTILRQEKLAAVGHFAAEMAHELNNHLQVVAAICECAFMEGPEPDDLYDVKAQMSALSAIVGDIRDFALGAAVAFNPVMTDPMVHLQEVVRTCRRHPAFKAITVSLQAERVPSWRLDGRQLKHLLLNLLKNAAKASSEGQEIRVSLESSESELTIAVIDHGIGVPDSQKEQVWEPFVTGWEYNGTGLGLCVVKHASELHGGSIECQDTPGGGATFVLRIPKGE